MSSSVFLLDQHQNLAELRPAPYSSEDWLRKLLATHPSILAVGSPSPVRLLLIQREFGVPESDGSSDRWSLDHLFVDQNGVPVL